MRPKTLLLEHYFFLEKRTWTWGTRWDEQEAEKHLRILKEMLVKNRPLAASSFPFVRVK
jgi:hypothetical protein